jgi:hypothetical protein
VYENPGHIRREDLPKGRERLVDLGMVQGVEPLALGLLQPDGAKEEAGKGERGGRDAGEQEREVSKDATVAEEAGEVLDRICQHASQEWTKGRSEWPACGEEGEGVAFVRPVGQFALRAKAAIQTGGGYIVRNIPSSS